MSQNFDLGSGYVEILGKYFITTIYVLCHKKLTKA